jgi:hypothetical protein
MGKIKNKIATLDEQIDFMRKLIHAVMDEKDSPFYGWFTDEKVDVMEGIVANLQTTQAWVNLPDFHQAAMHVLDAAFELNASDKRIQSLKLAQFFSAIKTMCEAISEQSHDQEAEMEKIAALALIAVAKFSVPHRPSTMDYVLKADQIRHDKEVGNG